MRVVSLVPSVTETLLAWGVTPVAVTRFCEHPELVHVGGTKDPDIAAIAALAPDLVVVNDEENRKEDFDALERAGLAVHVVRVATVDDVAPAMEALASAVGTSAAAPRRAAPRRATAVPSAPRVRADLASPVDDDERRDLRVVGARSPRRDQRLRRRAESVSDGDTRRRGSCAASTSCWPRASRTRSRRGTKPSSARSHRSRSSTARTSSGGASAPPDALDRLGAQLASLGEVPG